MTPRAAAVALAASALIAAPAFADEGNKQTTELSGGPNTAQGDKPDSTTAHYGRGYNDGDDRPRGYHPDGDRPSQYGRTDRYGNPVIRCESGDYRREYCRAPDGIRIRDVRISRQRSSADCVQGYSWGYDRNSIWVNDGCRADFALLNTRSSRDPNAGGHGNGNGVGYDHQVTRQMKRDARRQCNSVLDRRASMGGWQHAEFVDRPRVEQTGSNRLKVYGNVHLSDGYRSERQNVTCVVRRGTVRRFTDLAPAYDYRGNGQRGYGRHGRNGHRRNSY